MSGFFAILNFLSGFFSKFLNKQKIKEDNTMQFLGTNNNKKQLGDFSTRTPRKQDFTEYIYTFADGTKTVILRADLKSEVDDALYEELKKENTNNRTQLEEHRAYAKEQDKHEALIDNISSDDEIEEIVDSNIHKEKLNKALKTLKLEEQQLIIKKYVQEKKNTEIANDLGVTEGAVRDRLKRIIGKLQKLI